MRATLSDLAWVEVPLALARLHAQLAVGTTIELQLPPAPPDHRYPDDPTDVLRGGGFEPVGSGRLPTPGGDVLLRRERTLPDVAGPGMRALVCGLNPSLVSADAGFGYAGATNRFWTAALASRLVSVARRPLDALAVDGVGFTDMVKRPTARSHHLEPAEYGAGVRRLERLIGWLNPGVVIFVGLEGWRATRDRRAVPGWQTPDMAGRPAYVMPSTSGANARTSLGELVAHLERALAGPGTPAGG